MEETINKKKNLWLQLFLEVLKILIKNPVHTFGALILIYAIYLFVRMN